MVINHLLNGMILQEVKKHTLQADTVWSFCGQIDVGANLRPISTLSAHTSQVYRRIYLAKRTYFTNLGFPDIRGFPFLPYFFGVRSCEVAIIWSDIWQIAMYLWLPKPPPVQHEFVSRH